MNIQEFATQIYKKYAQKPVKDLIGKKRMISHITEDVNRLITKYNSNIIDAKKYYRTKYAEDDSSEEGDEIKLYFNPQQFNWSTFVDLCIKDTDLFIVPDFDFEGKTNIKYTNGKISSWSPVSIKGILYDNLIEIVWDIVRKLDILDVINKMGHECGLMHDDKRYGSILKDFFTFMNPDIEKNED